MELWILQLLISLVVALLAFFLKTLHGQHRELEMRQQRTELDIARTYATKPEVADASTRIERLFETLRAEINSKFERILSQLERKQDKTNADRL